MRGLLQYSLERIASLQHFYAEEKNGIEKKSNAGMNVTRFGYLMDMYFQILTNGSKEEREKKSFQSLEKYAKRYIEVIEFIKDKNQNNTGVSFRILNPEELVKKGFELNISKASSSYRQYADMPIIHGSNTLVMLITRFEEFISNFLGELYVLYPHKYLDKQQVSFSDIQKRGIDDIRRIIVEREVDAMMRESFSEWFKIFQSHGIKLESCSKELDILKELYARRNILVHNSGKVNETYLNYIPDTSASFGTRLDIDEEYLNTAFDAIRTIIFTVLIEAAKLIKEDKNSYLEDIFNFAFESLIDEKYSICSNVFNLLSQNKFLDANLRTMSQVDYWISVKSMFGLESIRNDIEAFDVSALDKMFFLAKLLLLDNNSAALNTIEELQKKNEFPMYVIETWPIFKDFRKSNEYKVFKERHPEAYGVATIDTTPEALDADKSTGKSIRKEVEVAKLSS